MADFDFGDVEVPCPILVYQRDSDEGRKTHSLFCQKMDIKADVYLSTAMLKMTAEWHNQESDDLDCVFLLPTNGTVTSVQASISGKDEVMLSGVIDNKTLKSKCGRTPPVDMEAEVARAGDLIRDPSAQTTIAGVPEDQNPYERYMPDLFRVPINGIPSGNTCTLCVEWMTTLPYKKGKGFHLKLPLTFQPGFILRDTRWIDVVSVKVKLNAITEITSYDSKSHELTLLAKSEDDSYWLQSGEMKAMDSKAALGTTVTSDSSAPQAFAGGVEKKLLDSDEQGLHSAGKDSIVTPSELIMCGRDFEMTFRTKGSKKIQMHALKKTDDVMVDYEGQPKTNIALFITPPRIPSSTFPRCFYILLDRSGSMRGEPYAEATRALQVILKEHVRSQDTFNVIAFDHRSLTWRPSPAEGNEMNKEHCFRWLEDMIPEKGGTNMMYPLKQALEELNRPSQQLLPYVILLTDGAVQNERDICTFVQDRTYSGQNKARIFTLGIGTYCNWFYLKMLAQLGRGLSEVLTETSDMHKRIRDFAKNCKTPLMTDIELEVEGVDRAGIDFYPPLIPDLYASAAVPVAIETTCLIDDVSVIKLRGYDPDRNVIELMCPVIDRGDLPIDRIFVKQKLDYLTAECWMDQKDHGATFDKASRLSIAHSMPAASVTTLVSFEMEREKAKAEGLLAPELDDDELPDEDGPLLQSSASIDSAGGKSKKNKGIGDWFQYKKTQEFVKKNPKMVAAAAGAGVVVVVATSAATFGDVGKTMGNLPLFGGDFDFDGEGDCDCGEDDDCCGDDCCDDDCTIM